jgi:hypothetical protein
MIDAFFGNRPIDAGRTDFAQAHARARYRRQGPRKTPAVAVEHRQGPQITRMRRHVPRERVAERIEIGTAMMRDDAFRISRRARRVGERDRLPLICGALPVEIGIAGGEQAFIVAVGRRAFFGDHENGWFAVRKFDCLTRDGLEILGDQQQFALGMIEDEGNRGRVEPCIDRIEHGARHRHTEMGFIKCRNIRGDDRDRIRPGDAATRQRARQAPTAIVGLPPAVAQSAVHDGRVIGIDTRRPPQQAQRRQRFKIGAVALQMRLKRIGRVRDSLRHEFLPQQSL